MRCHTHTFVAQRTHTSQTHLSSTCVHSHTQAVLDGPSQQIVFSTLSQLLTRARLGLLTPPTPDPHRASQLAEDANATHLRLLAAGGFAKYCALVAGLAHADDGWREDRPCNRRKDRPQPLELSLPGPCQAENAQPEVGSRSVERIISPHTIAALRQIAASSGMTLNAILLGTLATRLRARSGQDHFSIGQTYLGRRPEQLQAVGSYSTGADMEFTFDSSSSLLTTCKHAFEETMSTMAMPERLIEATALSNVLYELNDVRPMPRPPLNQGVLMPFVMSDLFFIVTEFTDDFVACVVYDVSKFARAGALELLLDWLEVLEGLEGLGE